jgi:hypothetical protein
VAEVSKKLPEPTGPAGNAALAGVAALAGTRAAGKAISVAASRSKMPLIAGASAGAGLLGGLAVIHRLRNVQRR